MEQQFYERLKNSVTLFCYLSLNYAYQFFLKFSQSGVGIYFMIVVKQIILGEKYNIIFILKQYLWNTYLCRNKILEKKIIYIYIRITQCRFSAMVFCHSCKNTKCQIQELTVYMSLYIVYRA